jgi:DNA-binding SARP family transcriptional activator/class 3 adenylate cyclase/WD40 repeat protein
MVAGGAPGAPVGTWTVLFTDQVGSTEMRVLVGEDAFDLIRADLDSRVAAALAEHGVAVTKSTGDGVMGGFTSTAAALRCAVAIQQAVEERNRTAGGGEPGGNAVALRVGISVGDAVVDNGDLQGTAVVEAARLCAAAPSGTIMCSEAVRAVSANRSGCAFGPASPVNLKGLPGPALAREVMWDPLPYEPGAQRLAFGVLGPLQILDGDRPVAVGGPKEHVVLAMLLARVGSPVSVDALIEAVWGDRPPRTAERTVHAYVARLRRALEPGRPRGEPSTMLVTVGRGYELRLGAARLDAVRFEHLARRGSDQLGRGDPAAPSTLREALGLWRGTAFGEFREVDACAAEAGRLDELRLAAMEDRVDADLAAGRSSELVGEIETLLRDQPFRERLWAQLVLALYRCGRQRDALDAYQRARRLLADELGIEPGPELRRLEAAILAQDPSLEVQRAAPAVALGGLPAALMAVGPAFFGRESELAWLRTAWAGAVDGRGGFVSVLGPEGIGKTRLVAELAREVRDDGAPVLYGRCDHAHRGARALLGQALQGAGSSLAHIDAGADDADAAEAVARYLPTWSQGRPVLLVLDDLHLADAATLEVVADLAGWCRAAPMLVVGAFRSDAAQPSGGDALAGGATQLVLGPLSGDAVECLCQLYAAEPWSQDDVGRIYELTGGNPLLVHEQASEWARERVSRRMAQAGARMAATHRRLVASRDEVADGVEGIQRMLEQRRAQLAGREAQLKASAVAALGTCPYKGLARFEQADAANFFGRERLVAELVARLAGSRMLAVVGPSGSGKSSLVRAGLLPALAAGVLPGGQPWRGTVVCPGPHPARDSAPCPDDDGSTGAPRVVFVDQFEETFTAGADRAEQEQFISHLLALADRTDTAVVLAVRADHLGRCATFPELADRLAGNDVLVGPMRDSELRRTIELPAQRAGLEIEPGLVEVIVADVAGRAGALPLLSTALAETWERREARALTLAGYRAAGGVNGALARMAEDAYAALPDGPRAAARRLLLRLCDAGEGGDLSLRRRLPVAEAADEHDADARAALDLLADRRLLTIDRDAVEVAHEALLREWPRLRAWLGEDVQGRWLHRRLHEAARAWEAAGHDPSELYRGTRLGAAVDWATGHADELSHGERAFIAASRAQSEQELADAQRQAADRARANRRLRAQMVALAVALVVAVLVGSVAVNQRKRASDAADAARAEAVRADASRLATRSSQQLGERLDVALLLAVEAHRRYDSAETREALWNALAATVPAGDPGQGVLDGFLYPELDKVSALDVSAHGEAATFGGSVGETAGRVVIVDTGDGRELARLDLDAPVSAVGFLADRTVIVAAEDGTVVRWDIDADRLASLRPSEGRPVLSLDVDPLHSTVAAGTRDGDVLVWDLAGRATAPRQLGQATGVPAAVRFSPTGELAATTSGGTAVQRWDPRSGAPVGPPLVAAGDGAPAEALAYSRDGNLLAAAPIGGAVTVWDLSSAGPARVAATVADVDPVALAFDPAPDRAGVFAAVTGGRELVLVDVGGSEPTRRARGGWAAASAAVGFSGDGSVLLTAAENGRAARWLPTSGRTPLSDGLPPAWDSAYASRDGHLVIGWRRRTDPGQPAEVFDPSTRRVVGTVSVPADRYPTDARTDASGRRVALLTYQYLERSGGGLTGVVVVIADLPTGRVTATIAVDSAQAGFRLDLSPDGSTLAVASPSSGLELWDADSGERRLSPDLGADGVRDVAFAPDGTLAVAVIGRVLLVRPSDGTIVRELRTPSAVQRLAIDRAGTMLAAGDSAGHIYRWALPAGDRLSTWTPGFGSVANLALADDGSAAVALTNQLVLLDPTGAQIGEPLPTDDFTRPVSFVSDGATAVASTAQGVRTLPLDSGDLAARACAVAGRELTADEWADIVHGPRHRTCGD